MKIFKSILIRPKYIKIIKKKLKQFLSSINNSLFYNKTSTHIKIISNKI